MSLLAIVDSRFTTTDLTHFLANIDENFVLPFVWTCSSDAPRYILGGSDLSPFSFNTHFIPYIIFMETQLITSTPHPNHIWMYV